MGNLPEVCTEFGAPMGRRERWPPFAVDGVITICQIAIDSEGYDSGGAYWGIPNNLYHCTNDESELSVFYRGRSLDHIKEKLLKLFPQATFIEVLDLDVFIQGYLEAAVFLVEDDYVGVVDINDFTKIARKRAEKDCRQFMKEAGDLLSGCDMSLAGNDFWLTRDHHGTGFWDRPQTYHGKENADKLVKIAHGFCEINTYVSRRKKISFE